MARLLRLVALTVAALVLAGCSSLFNPLEGDAEEAGVDLEVVGCEFDATTKVAKAIVEVTSEKDYSTILLNGELTDASGIVIATTSGSLTGVNAGKTYRHELVFGLQGEPEGEVACDVTMEFAASDFTQ